MTGTALECATFQSIWRDSVPSIDQEVYCGWGNARCVYRDGKQVPLPYSPYQLPDGIQEFPSLLIDWRSTSRQDRGRSTWFCPWATGPPHLLPLLGGTPPPSLSPWPGAAGVWTLRSG